MIPGSKGYMFYASMTFGPVKHEKVDRIGRISKVFRIVGAHSAWQSVGIMGQKAKNMNKKALASTRALKS